jgi:serine/threonine-protein kinase RsbW
MHSNYLLPFRSMNPDGSRRRLRLASTRQIPAVIKTVTKDMAALEYTEKDLWSMCMALEEALVNAFKHGNQMDPAKRVWVRSRVNDRRALIHVLDEGGGFTPQEVADPLDPENLERASGQGLLLMRSFMTWVRHNKRGNLVTLCKKRCVRR